MFRNTICHKSLLVVNAFVLPTSGRTNIEEDLQITRDLGEGFYERKKKRNATPVRAE